MFSITRKSRTTFDTSDTRRGYGPIIIDYAKVQAKVTLKYDSWHKEALSKFGSLLGNEMQTFHSKVSKSRSDLELQSIGKIFLFQFCYLIISSVNNQFDYAIYYWLLFLFSRLSPPSEGS